MPLCLEFKKEPSHRRKRNIMDELKGKVGKYCIKETKWKKTCKEIVTVFHAIDYHTTNYLGDFWGIASYLCYLMKLDWKDYIYTRME